MKLKKLLMMPLFGAMFLFTSVIYAQKGEVNFVDFEDQKGLYDTNDEFKFSRIWLFKEVIVNRYDTGKPVRDEKTKGNFNIYIYGDKFNEMRITLDNKKQYRFRRETDFCSLGRDSDPATNIIYEKPKLFFAARYSNKTNEADDYVYIISIFKDRLELCRMYEGRTDTVFVFNDYTKDNIYRDYNEKFFYSEYERSHYGFK